MGIVMCDSASCDDVGCLELRKEAAKKAYEEAKKAYAEAIKAVYNAKANEEIDALLY